MIAHNGRNHRKTVPLADVVRPFEEKLAAFGDQLSTKEFKEAIRLGKESAKLFRGNII
jgi:hypothetical protein